MNLSIDELASLLEPSKLHPAFTEEELINFCVEARKHKFATVYVLPANLEFLVKNFGNCSAKIGTGIGFPFGTHTTKTKLLESEEAMKIGAEELDMVINIGALKSGKYYLVENEISQLKKLVGKKVLKVILEVSYLNEKEIIMGTKICCAAGADYVKTGTGFGSRPTSYNDIKLIKNAIDKRIKIKAAGGIKDVATLLKMYDMGVTRFGVSRGLGLIEEYENKYYKND